LAWRLLRDVRDARRCVENGEEIVLDVIGVENERNRGRLVAVKYRYRMPDGGGEQEIRFAPGAPPFFVDPKGDRMLPLVSRDATRPVVSRRDLWPLDTPADEARALLEKTQSGSAC